MKDFTASNRIPVTLTDDGRLLLFEIDHTYPVTVAGGNDVDALREFFRAEGDERLGRWRWPENPGYVVYLVGDDIVDVLRESSVSDEHRGPGRQAGITRDAARTWDNDYSQNFFRAARAFFDAHPEPKPWHDANHNEIWVLFVAISEEAYRVDGGSFVPVNNPERIRIPLRDERIKSAHRIYPEGEVNA